MQDKEIAVIKQEIARINNIIVSKKMNSYDALDRMINNLKTMIDNYNFDQKYNFARALNANTPEEYFRLCLKNRNVKKIKLYVNKTLFTYDYDLEKQQLTFCELIKQNKELFPQYELALKLSLLFNYDLYKKYIIEKITPDYQKMLSSHGIKPKKQYYYFDELRAEYKLNGTSNTQLKNNLQIIESTLFPNELMYRFKSVDLNRLAFTTTHVQQAEPVLNGILDVLAGGLDDSWTYTKPDLFKSRNPLWCKFNQGYYCNKFKMPCHTSIHCSYYKSNR